MQEKLIEALKKALVASSPALKALIKVFITAFIGALGFAWLSPELIQRILGALGN